jgi:hypothetical protein
MSPRPNRREFLAASSAALLAAGCSSVSDPAAESQRMPEPAIALPTDGVVREGPAKRIAAITTAYYKYSHADDIITKFIEGYSVIGRTHLPHCKVVSLYVDQFPDTDISRGMAAKYKIPIFDAPAKALTLGGKELAVDGVLLVGEHGDYPFNDKGQQLYPRRKLFEEIVKGFRAAGKSVPVYNDKHLSYSWDDAAWMVGQSREMGFPMMAGSSVPVTWRRPPLELRAGTGLEGALSVGYGGVEAYGFHTLEALQVFTERRKGGETGVRAVQCLEGAEAWKAAEQGRWRLDLLDAALARIPERRGRLREADAKAVVFLIDYADGLQAAAYLSRSHVAEWAFAGKLEGRAGPASTWFYMPKPQRDHFSFLSNHIEKMFLTGRSSYPVERTLLTTGMLAHLMDSRFAGGKRIETPGLAGVRYQPVG